MTMTAKIKSVVRDVKLVQDPGDQGQGKADRRQSHRQRPTSPRRRGRELKGSLNQFAKKIKDAIRS
jgi:hypothetical protein